MTYADEGRKTDPGIFFFHGTPGSRLLVPRTTLPLRVVAPDRPGYGGSDPWPRRRLLEWTQDVSELADILGIDSFAVVGAPGGGPHALACAASLTERIVGTAVVSGPAPPFEKPGKLAEMDDDDREIVEVALRDMAAARRMLDTRGQWILDLLAEPKRLVRGLPVEADRKTLGDPQLQASTLVALRESVRHGLEGYAWDWLAIRLPWEFVLGDIRMPLRIWHGTLDENVPFDDALWFANEIPGATLTTWAGEGHWGLFAHSDDVFTSFVKPSS
jgi:pimeloyl-ACP methyl ester carboxylesterase